MLHLKKTIASAVNPSLASSTIRAHLLRRVPVPDQPLQSFTIGAPIEICSIFLIGADLQVSADL
jgi:hypothetical protein